MRLADKQKKDAAGNIRQSSFVLQLISLVLLTACFVTSTLAWVSLNENNQSNQMKMNVDYDKFYVEATYYKFNAKEQVVESSSNLTDIHFNQYDLVFRSRNRYTPIVAAIKMTGEDLPKESGTIGLLISRDASVSGSQEDSNGVLKMAQNFSTIMRVTAFVGESYYSSDSKTLFKKVDSEINYSQARAQTGNVSNSKIFTSVDVIDSNGTMIFREVNCRDIQIDISYTSSDFNDVDGDGIKESLFVYLYITYDEGYDGTNYNGLLGLFQKTSDTLGISATGDISEQSLLFKNDLISIKVSHSHS
ncbi:MAG: hypothetical protein K6F14_07990 [Clostridiales bacterium]|nr:hypothetical protein [Clostridiales bacterium]